MASQLKPKSRDGTESKLFAGPRVRRLRAGLGLSQARMAEDLSVSPSYLNLIERNQRPVTAQFLLRLATVFNIDVRDLTGDLTDALMGSLAEALSDPMFRSLTVSRSEIQDAAQSTPAVSEALVRLYGAYRDAVTARTTVDSEDSVRETLDARSPLEQVRELIQSRQNHFPELEAQGEALAEELRITGDGLLTALKTRLSSKHSISVRILPADVLPESLRRYDHHRKQLQLSELLDPPGRVFQALVQIAQLEARTVIEAHVNESGFTDDASRRLLRINLANYFAASVLMPYGRFHAAAEETGYDLALLVTRFGASIEQVCHRLTTLQRSSMRGVPFFLIRVDQAGNVSKRFSAGRFHFSKFGGTCPLWHVHAAFRQPGDVLRQIIEMPDGTRYFSIASTVRAYTLPWGEPAPQFAVALGCELKYARHLIYARGLDLDTPTTTPIGTNCALCPRDTCRQRSQPPVAGRLIIDERVRGPSAFGFTV